METSVEKRFYPRKEINTHVLYRFEGESEFSSRQSINISPGGVLLETENSFTEGKTLELHFSLPNSPQLIKAQGKVAWVKKKEKEEIKPEAVAHFLAGIEFTQIGDDSKRIIKEFLEKNLY